MKLNHILDHAIDEYLKQWKTLNKLANNSIKSSLRLTQAYKLKQTSVIYWLIEGSRPPQPLLRHALPHQWR